METLLPVRVLKGPCKLERLDFWSSSYFSNRISRTEIRKGKIATPRSGLQVLPTANHDELLSSKFVEDHMEMKKLPLAKLARAVAEELRNADIQAKQDGKAIMQFVECELEIGFEVETSADGSVNLWAVELGTSGSKTTSHTVRVKYVSMPGTTTVALQTTGNG